MTRGLAFGGQRFSPGPAESSGVPLTWGYRRVYVPRNGSQPGKHAPLRRIPSIRFRDLACWCAGASGVRIRGRIAFHGTVHF